MCLNPASFGVKGRCIWLRSVPVGYQIFTFLKCVDFHSITEFIIELGLLIVIIIDLADFIRFKIKR